MPAPAPHPAATDPRPDRRRLGALLATAAAAAAAVALLPGLQDVRARFTGADPGWLAVAGALELASVLAFVVAFHGVVAERLPWRLSYRVAVAAQGANVLVPTGGAGGLALAGWALGRTGMTARAAGRRLVTLFTSTSSVNFLTALLGGLLLAAGLLPGAVPVELSLGPAAAALAVIAAAVAVARVLGDRPGRAGVLAAGLRDTWRLVSQRRAGALAGAVGYMAFDLAALAAAFAAVGAVPPLGILLVAYPLGQLGGLIPLPGGVGGTDGGLIGVLVLYGTPVTTAAAAVLSYRVFQLGLPALLGSLALGGLAGAARPAACRSRALRPAACDAARA